LTFISIGDPVIFRGLIKRPTIFRSHKIRVIWRTKESLVKDLGDLKSLSNLTEILPLIDPLQEVRKKLSRQQLADIYKHACYDPPMKFKKYIKILKQKYAHDRLGRSLNRAKYLKELDIVVKNLRSLIGYLSRERQRGQTPKLKFRERTIRRFSFCEFMDFRGTPNL